MYFGTYKRKPVAPIESFPAQDRLPKTLSPTDLEPYSYESIDASQQIRLLELLPPRRQSEDSKDLLKCRLHTCSLNDKRPYTALSYTWGTIERHLPISVLSSKTAEEDDEEALFATPQLMLALRRLRHPTNSRFLWIDQLCINQEDKQEKSFQIHLMGEIYRIAQEVIIWLGEDAEEVVWSEPGGPRVLHSQLIADAVRHLEVSHDSPHTWIDVRPTYHVNDRQQVTMRAVVDLLNRPWFTRAWVYQEASLAKKLTIRYGGAEISFEQAKTLCDVVHSAQNGGTPHGAATIAEETPGYELLQFITQNRSQVQSQQMLPGHHEKMPGNGGFLWKLLQILPRIECFDKRDLIFAFLAFQGEEQIEASDDWYDKPIEEVWTYATERIIRSSGSIDVFAAVCKDWDKEITLPSWVPDWAECMPFGPPFITPTTHFRAARDLTHVWRPHTDPRKLRVMGKIIDKVHQGSFRYREPTRPYLAFRSSVSTTAFHISMIMLDKWHGDILVDFRTVLGDHFSTMRGGAHRDLMRVVLADGALGSRQPLRDHLDDLIDLNLASNEIFEMWKNKRPDEMTTAERQQLNEYRELERLLLVTEQKQVFFTEHFQLGMAPRGVRPGDHIAILHGSKTPCVLRVVDEKEHEYRIISQCYLDGWMFGRPRAIIPRPHPHGQWWEEEPDEFVLV